MFLEQIHSSKSAFATLLQVSLGWSLFSGLIDELRVAAAFDLDGLEAATQLFEVVMEVDREQ